MLQLDGTVEDVHMVIHRMGSFSPLDDDVPLPCLHKGKKPVSPSTTLMPSTSLVGGATSGDLGSSRGSQRKVSFAEQIEHLALSPAMAVPVPVEGILQKQLPTGSPVSSGNSEWRYSQPGVADARPDGTTTMTAPNCSNNDAFGDSDSLESSCDGVDDTERSWPTTSLQYAVSPSSALTGDKSVSFGDYDIPKNLSSLEAINLDNNNNNNNTIDDNIVDLAKRSSADIAKQIIDSVGGKEQYIRRMQSLFSSS